MDKKENVDADKTEQRAAHVPPTAAHRADAGATHPTMRAAYGHKPSKQRRRAVPRKALAAAALVLALVLGAGLWMFKLRPVSLTVNDTDLSVSVSTPLADVMKENDWFGAVPGRLLSVGGNVLDEDGGNAPIVTCEGEELSADEVATAAVREGATYAVVNGTDMQEPSHEETVAVSPAVQMERGGAVQYVSQWGKPGSKTVLVGEQSGEMVDKEILQPAQDMVVSSVNLKPKGGKYAALTFDDGPSKYTPQILEVLKEKGARATFFNLGQSAAGDPAGVKAIVDAGCEVASHTNSHQNLPQLDRDTLRSEITSAFDTLEQASGTAIQMMRAPYGAFTDVEWGRAGDLISCNVLWNIDTLDWKRPGAQAITNAVLNNVKNGSIILMHDGGGNRSQDVEALPGIIDGLHEQGYQLVTVSELIDLDGRLPQAVAQGAVAMPEGSELPAV